MTLDQTGKIVFKIIKFELIWSFIEMGGYSADSTGIAIDSRFAFTLSLECAKMLLVQ